MYSETECTARPRTIDLPPAVETETKSPPAAVGWGAATWDRRGPPRGREPRRHSLNAASAVQFLRQPREPWGHPSRFRQRLLGDPLEPDQVFRQDIEAVSIWADQGYRRTAQRRVDFDLGGASRWIIHVGRHRSAGRTSSPVVPFTSAVFGFDVIEHRNLPGDLVWRT